MSKIEKREQRFLDLLQNYRRLDISQAAQYLHISETTARRMASKLEEAKKVVRTHGGVQLSEQYSSEYSYKSRELRNHEEKAAIANYCASLIQPGDRIFCDSGTTIHRFVLSIVQRIQNENLQDVVVLSNSLANFDPIANFCKVILLGGEIRLSRMDVCGSITEDTIRKFHITKAFVGGDAIHSRMGVMTTDERTAWINKIVLSDAEQTYILADSSKFEKTSFISYADQNNITEIVTDWNLPKNIELLFTQMGYRIRVLNKTEFSEA